MGGKGGSKQRRHSLLISADLGESCASASAALPEEAPVAAERGAAGGAEGGVCGLPVAT